jgi:hypothetical protein
MNKSDEIEKNDSYDSGYIVTSRGIESTRIVNARALIRKQIDSISDSDTREGILSDVLGILLVNFSHLVLELTKVKTFEDIKSISQPIYELFSTIEEDIKNNLFTLPYMVKPDGASKTFSDMKNLSNRISNILIKSQS